jgi:hypothetical protein
MSSSPFCSGVHRQGKIGTLDSPNGENPVMFWFRVTVLMRFSFRGLCFLVPPPLPAPLLAPALPCRLVDMVDILVGMVNLDLLFFISNWT